MEKTIVINRIKTPDGTILTSYHRHDFKTYVDANGKTYGVDGGLDYLKRIGDQDYEELSIYSDAPFEVIRENFGRINRGKDGNQEPKFILLKDMDDEWLNNVVIWNIEKGIDNYYTNLYKEEQWYRANNSLNVDDIEFGAFLG